MKTLYKAQVRCQAVAGVHINPRDVAYIPDNGKSYIVLKHSWLDESQQIFKLIVEAAKVLASQRSEVVRQAVAIYCSDKRTLICIVPYIHTQERKIRTDRDTITLTVMSFDKAGTMTEFGKEIVDAIA